MFNPSFCKHIISFYKIQDIKNTGLANIDISWSRNTKAELGLKLDYFKIYYLFIYFWLPWVFVAAHGLSLVALSRASLWLQYGGFSLRWLL